MRTIIHTHWCMYVCMYCLTIHDMFLSILKFMAKGKDSTSWTFSTQGFLHIWWCQPQIYQVWHLNAYDDGLSHLGYEPSIGVFYWSITLPLPTHHHLHGLRFMTMVLTNGRTIGYLEWFSETYYGIYSTQMMKWAVRALRMCTQDILQFSTIVCLILFCP